MPKTKQQIQHSPEERTPAMQEIKMAVLQLALGQIQIVGAAAGFYLLVATGASLTTVGVVAVTTLAAIISKILFRKK